MSVNLFTHPLVRATLRDDTLQDFVRLIVGRLSFVL